MKIKSLEIDGFRCLLDFKINFESDMTIIVGENDSGKSSLIDCLKIITQNKKIETTDFNEEKSQILIMIEIDDYIFKKEYILENSFINEKSLKAYPTNEFIENLKNLLNQDDFDLTQTTNTEFIRNLAKTFGLQVRVNSNDENLLKSIRELINKDEVIIIEDARFPQFNNIQLDGKQFESVSSFFKEVFLKEKQSSVWNEKIDTTTNQTIDEFIKNKIDNYSVEISSKIIERGIIDKIKIFLKDLTEIRIEPVYQKQDLNIDARIKFLENGKEIDLQKKGDGTKRRITMALLEFKRDESIISSDTTTIYLLDEPDTHLHVKAQIELLETLESFASQNNQIILTTHSPFIINHVMPRQIRMLIPSEQNKTTVKYIKSEIALENKVLRSLGIENTYLFFAKKLILVEGETEESFIPILYNRLKNRTLSSNLIKIINVKGINNIYGFAEGILQIHDKRNIFMLYDNDASDEVNEIIERLNLDENQKFRVGEKEFEDAFLSKSIFECWKIYHDMSGKACPNCWSIDTIESLKNECLNNGTKFSKELKRLNSGGKSMTKPLLGQVIAEHIEIEDIPEIVINLINTL